MLRRKKGVTDCRGKPKVRLQKDVIGSGVGGKVLGGGGGGGRCAQKRGSWTTGGKA